MCRKITAGCSGVRGVVEISAMGEMKDVEVTKQDMPCSIGFCTLGNSGDPRVGLV